jgi:two-component system, NtrC family, nitrogen regulation response regulator GlnG
VQPMLLRVLEDHVIRPLGSSKPIKVDVRIIAATDAKLERAVLEHRFALSLYNRLNSAVVVALPPLRERREDIGSLLVNYLRKGFGDTALLQRLQDPDRQGGPWLSARDVATVAVSPLSGNVRTIIGLTRNLIAKAGDPPGDTHELVKKFLARKEPSATSDSESAVVPAGRAVVTKEKLLATLEKANWNHAGAATLLGVSRITVWRWITKDPELRRIVEERSTATSHKP